jgi:hypothetical protein
MDMQVHILTVGRASVCVRSPDKIDGKFQSILARNSQILGTETQTSRTCLATATEAPPTRFSPDNNQTSRSRRLIS